MALTRLNSKCAAWSRSTTARLTAQSAGQIKQILVGQAEAKTDRSEVEAVYGTFVRSAERQERCSRFSLVARATKRSTICKLRPHESNTSPLLEEVVPDAPLLAAVVAEELDAREVKGAPAVEPELRLIFRVGLL